ncbi:uncharacterized protein LOC142981085 [Anticarsia gemmatalis]|uniref:uncharacterized protein LOC142981085 n=1 Tax=Anticarsia gemmatalis TaxID=129554 RepID=UPI003F76B45B
MRRGHIGISGWRNENQRHFRPRAGGSPRFRPPRNYQCVEVPRFPPPGPRLHRGSHPYNTHSGRSDEHRPSDQHDRNNYRNHSHHQNIPSRIQDRGHQQRSRLDYSYTHSSLTQDDNNQSNTYNTPPNFYKDNQLETFHINSLGDVDHRQLSNVPQSQDTFSSHRINPWVNPPPPYYEDQSPQKYYRPHDNERQSTEGNRIPSLDYTGHRPPSSDYYGSTSGTTVNNNNTSFSRSVDDTVDLVRKRLMNRNDPQRLSQDALTNQSTIEQETRENSNQHVQQEPPVKKRVQKQRQNVKSNCDKMKSNIVHQLFKMDKDKMHKLMDDPGSSSKFEYAISSLITESQNSLNRHMRSVAEKSLVSSSSDFIHNDNNTIYEDTFMKQMQCLLDPQDTVLLEDIKPLVMAELSKVLQLDDFDPRYDVEEQYAQTTRTDQVNYPSFDQYNYNEFPQERHYDVDQRIPSLFENPIAAADVIDNPSQTQNYDYNFVEVKQEKDYEEPRPLFERRPSKKKDHNEERRQSVESLKLRRSLDNPINSLFPASEEAPPLFDCNAQLSEEEDTFAELDRQYHVAVDHTFNDDVSARTTPVPGPEVSAPTVKTEVVSQLETFIKSPLALFSSSGTDKQAEPKTLPRIKQEIIQSPDFPKENVYSKDAVNNAQRLEPMNSKQDQAPSCKPPAKEAEKSEPPTISKTSQSNSRKRSIDQRPSHRKEKRKKSESSNTEPKTSHRHNSNISQDRHPKVLENPKPSEAPKSYYSIFKPRDVSTKDQPKDDKRTDTAEKAYSDKYVKRKDTRKSKEREPKKRTSSSSSQTILSPKESNNTSVTTPTKGDPKTKLKPIDMFVEQPKKVSLHQAHRNTAPTPVVPPKPVEEIKSKQASVSTQKQPQVKHASTQVIKRVISKETQTFESKVVTARFCQTDKPDVVSIGVQTPRVFDKVKPKPVDALERMKEIDMEIQDLLQEKFKLYHNLESGVACPDAMNLGMTVVNYHEDGRADIKEIPFRDSVTPNPDSIAEDFTNIPVEELEEIALETVEHENLDETKVEKRSARQKALQQQRMNSESPSSTCSRRSRKKTKTPNISLIEQIITDDRPLEDIISLDDLETASPKHRKRPQRPQPKKKPSKKSKPVPSPQQKESYDIKECSVLLIQTDMTKYLKELENQPQFETSVHIEVLGGSDSCGESSEKPKSSRSAIVEDNVVNDLQFDMLDVSEDIVIGESCDMKDKQAATISEDLILDNSQSSADDVFSSEAGQHENECKTYDYSNDEELRRDSLTVTGHLDAVLAIECIETDFIAACLDGNVYHFSGDGQLLNTMRGSNLAVTCLTIVKEKYGTTVYTGSLDSRIRYYDLETGLEKGPECNVLSPIQTMDRAWDTVFVGTRTGFVLQFECKNNMLIPVSTVKFSEQAILALRAMKEGPRKVLLVASRSENVTVKDAQTGLLLRTLVGPKMTVYTLLFEDGKVYCGTSSHQIHVFDYASGSHTGCHEGGKGAVCLRATGGLVFAGCYDGCVYVYREGDTRPLAQLRGPSLMLLSLAVVGSKIIAGYKDRSLYIWKIPLNILQEMIL